MEMWWLIGRCGGALGDVVAHWEMWRLIGRCGGSLGDVVAHYGNVVAQYEDVVAYWKCIGHLGQRSRVRNRHFSLMRCKTMCINNVENLRVQRETNS